MSIDSTDFELTPEDLRIRARTILVHNIRGHEMAHGRDATLMLENEYDRNESAKLRPAERASIALFYLYEYDRCRFPEWASL